MRNRTGNGRSRGGGPTADTASPPAVRRASNGVGLRQGLLAVACTGARRQLDTTAAILDRAASRFPVAAISFPTLPKPYGGIPL